mmetsp:Transcript_26876/g.62240  ORF Transcript_26876/g.62240 Transcript_26876/m.62240 type:complete len:205 (+) Transcript_26876:70-684(+)
MDGLSIIDKLHFINIQPPPAPRTPGGFPQGAVSLSHASESYFFTPCFSKAAGSPSLTAGEALMAVLLWSMSLSLGTFKYVASISSLPVTGEPAASAHSTAFLGLRRKRRSSWDWQARIWGWRRVRSPRHARTSTWEPSKRRRSSTWRVQGISSEFMKTHNSQLVLANARSKWCLRKCALTRGRCLLTYSFRTSWSTLRPTRDLW